MPIQIGKLKFAALFRKKLHQLQNLSFCYCFEKRPLYHFTDFTTVLPDLHLPDLPHKKSCDHCDKSTQICPNLLSDGRQTASRSRSSLRFLQWCQWIRRGFRLDTRKGGGVAWGPYLSQTRRFGQTLSDGPPCQPFAGLLTNPILYSLLFFFHDWVCPPDIVHMYYIVHTGRHCYLSFPPVTPTNLTLSLWILWGLFLGDTLPSEVPQPCPVRCFRN